MNVTYLVSSKKMGAFSGYMNHNEVSMLSPWSVNLERPWLSQSK